jgi:hypothetical protein
VVILRVLPQAEDIDLAAEETAAQRLIRDELRDADGRVVVRIA